MSKDYVENLITVMTKKDTKSKEAMNILVFQTLNALLQRKKTGFRFNLAINGQITSYLSHLLLRHFQNLINQTLAFRKRYLINFLFPQRDIVKKQRKTRQKTKNYNVGARSNIEDAVRRSLEYSNSNTQIPRLKTQEPYFNKQQELGPYLRGNDFEYAIRNIAQQLNQQNLIAINAHPDGSPLKHNNPKLQAEGIFVNNLEQKIDQSARISRKQLSLFLNYDSPVNRSRIPKTKQKSKGNKRNNLSLIKTTVDKKTYFSQKTQTQTQTQCNQTILKDTKKFKIGLNNFDSPVQVLLNEIQFLCNANTNPIVNIMKNTKRNNQNLFNFNQLHSENIRNQQQNTQFSFFENHQGFVTPPKIQIKDEYLTSSFKSNQLSEWQSFNLAIQKLNKNNTQNNQSINLNQYFKKQQLNSTSKASIFMNILNSGYQLKQQNPKQFSDIFVSNLSESRLRFNPFGSK